MKRVGKNIELTGITEVEKKKDSNKLCLQLTLFFNRIKQILFITIVN